MSSSPFSSLTVLREKPFIESSKNIPSAISTHSKRSLNEEKGKLLRESKSRRAFCDARCFAERKLQTRELQKWSRNLLTLIGLEHASRRAAGPRTYKQLCSAIKASACSTTRFDFCANEKDEKCTWCGGSRLSADSVSSLVHTTTGANSVWGATQISFDTGLLKPQMLADAATSNKTLAMNTIHSMRRSASPHYAKTDELTEKSGGSADAEMSPLNSTAPQSLCSSNLSSSGGEASAAHSDSFLPLLQQMQFGGGISGGDSGGGSSSSYAHDDNAAALKQLSALLSADYLTTRAQQKQRVDSAEQTQQQQQQLAAMLQLSALFPSASSTLLNSSAVPISPANASSIFSTLVEQQNALRQQSNDRKEEKATTAATLAATKQAKYPLDNSPAAQQWQQQLSALSAANAAPFLGMLPLTDAQLLQRFLQWQAQILALNVMTSSLFGNLSSPTSTATNYGFPGVTSATNNKKAADCNKMEGTAAGANLQKDIFAPADDECQPLDLSAKSRSATSGEHFATKKRDANGGGAGSVEKVGRRTTSVEQLLTHTDPLLSDSSLAVKFNSSNGSSANNNNNNNSALEERKAQLGKPSKIVTVKMKNNLSPTVDPKSQLLGTKRNYTQADLNAAVYDIRCGRLGTRRASVVYGIPRSTLRNKIYKLEAAEDNGDGSSKRRRLNAYAMRKKERTVQQQMLKRGVYVPATISDSPCLPSTSMEERIITRPSFDSTIASVVSGGGSAADWQQQPFTFSAVPPPTVTLTTVAAATDCCAPTAKRKLSASSSNDAAVAQSYFGCEPTDLSKNCSTTSLSHSMSMLAASNLIFSTASCSSLENQLSTFTNNVKQESSSIPAGNSAENSIAKSLAASELLLALGKASKSSLARDKTTKNSKCAAVSADVLRELGRASIAHLPKGETSEGRKSRSNKELRKVDWEGDVDEAAEVYSDSPTSPQPAVGAISAECTANNSGDENEAEKRSRPKRGQYRRYDKGALEEAVQAVKKGNMSVHRAGSFYGVPHSTLEYKVKERNKLRPKSRRATSLLQTVAAYAVNENVKRQRADNAASLNEDSAQDSNSELDSMKVTHSESALDVVNRSASSDVKIEASISEMKPQKRRKLDDENEALGDDSNGHEDDSDGCAIKKSKDALVISEAQNDAQNGKNVVEMSAGRTPTPTAVLITSA